MVLFWHVRAGFKGLGVEVEMRQLRQAGPVLSVFKARFEVSPLLEPINLTIDLIYFEPQLKEFPFAALLNRPSVIIRDGAPEIVGAMEKPDGFDKVLGANAL